MHLRRLGDWLALRGVEDFGVGSFVDGDDWVVDYLDPAVEVWVIELELILVSWEARRLDVLSVVVLGRYDFEVHLLRRETNIHG